MDESVTLHVVAHGEAERERIAGALAGLSPTVHDSIESFRGQAGGERCAVVVDVAGGIDFRELLDLCDEVADRDREWIVLLPRENAEDGLAFRPLSAGFALDADDLPSMLTGEEEEGPPFDLHEVLRFVARVRHDINNPLTAGMAETQLLLMDLGGEGEVGESLQTVERQLQRIKALVEDLTRLQRPTRDAS